MFFAYLDAGSGSLILQAVLGGIAGIIVAAKAWKARILAKGGTASEGQPETSADESALTES